MDHDKYFELWQLTALFGEDYDLFGETVDEIALSYAKGCSKELRDKIVDQIDAFRSANTEDLDAAFIETFGRLGRHDMWGHTPTSFLNVLRKILLN